MRTKHTFRLPPDLATRLADYAARLARARAWALKDPAPYAAVWSKLIGLPEAVPLRWFGRAEYRSEEHTSELQSH